MVAIHELYKLIDKSVRSPILQGMRSEANALQTGTSNLLCSFYICILTFEGVIYKLYTSNLYSIVYVYNIVFLLLFFSRISVIAHNLTFIELHIGSSLVGGSVIGGSTLQLYR